MSDDPASDATDIVWPDEGTPEWWLEVRREALALERHAVARRGGWYGQAVTEGADLHRWCLARTAALQLAAERLGPDDPAAWEMLARAAYIESERRLLELVLDATP